MSELDNFYDTQEAAATVLYYVSNYIRGGSIKNMQRAEWSMDVLAMVLSGATLDDACERADTLWSDETGHTMVTLGTVPAFTGVQAHIDRRDASGGVGYWRDLLKEGGYE